MNDFIPNIKKHKSYKESGLDWIDSIPSHWGLMKFKFLFKEINERSSEGSEDLLSVSQYTGVTKKRDNIEEGGMLTNASTLEGYKRVYAGDLVSNIMLAWNGSLGFSPYDGITSPAYSVYRLLGGYNRQYFHYLLRSEVYKAEFKRNSSGVIESRLRLYTDDFYRIYSLVPPINEQNAIARFLDTKIALIDKAIAIKEKQIELLKERRQILIHQAVTRGLNPHVKMKDSGVEWIGEVPEHWEVKYNRRLFREKSRKITNSNELALSLSQVDGVLPSEDMKERSLSPSHRDNFKLCLPGDLIVNRFKGHLGVFFESTYRGIITFHYGVFEPERDVLTKYYEYLFHTDIYKIIYAGASNGMTIGLQNLSNQNFYDIKSIAPPYEEQQSIVNTISIIDLKVKKAIESKEAEISKLIELKSSLINSAVIGKIKVV